MGQPFTYEITQQVPKILPIYNLDEYRWITILFVY